MRPALAVHGPLSRAVFVTAVLVSLAVLFTPGSDVPLVPPGVDKIVHAVLFALLAACGRWAGIDGRVLGWLLLLYAAGSEVAQALLVPGRSGSIGDLLADVVGMVTALLMWEVLSRVEGRDV